jgi:uncharacterized RDD family membrane protein YckC
VSVLTGEVLFSGPARNFQLISGTSFQAVAAGLLVLMVAVILFVLRAEPGRLPRLPEHLELASPIRRTLAGLIDYLPGALLAAQVLGLPTFSLIRISQIVQLEQAMASLGLTLVISMLLATIGEAVSGRSLGKAAMGLRVYSTPPPTPPSTPSPRAPKPGAEPGAEASGPGYPAGPRRMDPGAQPGAEASGPDAALEVAPIKLWQAAARNLVRWMIPVVSLLMMLDGGRRHPGDFAARTIVLQDREDQDPPSEGEG